MLNIYKASNKAETVNDPQNIKMAMGECKARKELKKKADDSYLATAHLPPFLGQLHKIKNKNVDSCKKYELKQKVVVATKSGD